jgi:hypothetical protein
MSTIAGDRSAIDAVDGAQPAAMNLVFQAHGVDAEGAVCFRKKVSRSKLEPFFAGLAPCLVGIEACASAHHWARVIRALGHEVRLMPPAYVKPYVKSQKNDAADAEAICEAVRRPTMRFTEVKSVAQQSMLAMHRVRAMLMRRRTRLGNTIRGHVAEFGVVAPIGRLGLETLIKLVKIEATIEFRPSCGARCSIWSINSINCACRFSISIARSWLRIATTRPAVGSQRSLVSGRSLQARWSRRSAMPRSFDRAGALRPTSVSYRARIRAAAKSASEASRSAAINICAGCSLAVRWRSFAMRNATARVGLGL